MLPSLLCYYLTSLPQGEITEIPASQVTLTDTFWQPMLKRNRLVTLPHEIKMCYETGRIKNFQIASGKVKGDFTGLFFNDSDVYKVIEAAGKALQVQMDPTLVEEIDKIIDEIAAAQASDGYLYTPKLVIERGFKAPVDPVRWSTIQHQHELYCAGHLYEAAVEYHKATGKRKLLDVAIKNANLVCKIFSPGARMEPPGHEEIEMGLVRLYEATGDQKYLDQAQFFLNQRGSQEGRDKLYGEYAQDHIPLLQQKEAVGHAVRAAYLYSGMAEVQRYRPSANYMPSLQSIWHNVVGTKMYVTGGIGASGSNEGFTFNYDLPNFSAYQETCATIANAMWNQRMFLLTGEAKYIDVQERAVYNGMLSGISHDGTHFFYPNRLAVADGATRTEWFECACCPPNIARYIASIPSFLYAKSENRLYANFYASSDMTSSMHGVPIRVKQESAYPWQGDIEFTLDPQDPVQFQLALRLPGWAQGQAVPSDLYNFANQKSGSYMLTVNGKTVPAQEVDGYLILDRTWKAGDKVKLVLPMEVEFVTAHDKVTEVQGQVAIQRGPFVYCAEFPDQPDGSVLSKVINPQLSKLVKSKETKFGEIVTIQLPAYTARRELGGDVKLESERKTLQLIPYYLWANRGLGEMAVWLATKPEFAWPAPAPTIVAKSKITTSHNRGGKEVADQRTPANSAEGAGSHVHWWPRKGTEEWIQLDFAQAETISSLDIYWFDDRSIHGECRVPEKWVIKVKQGNQWVEPKEISAYGLELDKFNHVTFAPVKTSGVRIELKSQDKWSTGVHEIIIK